MRLKSGVRAVFVFLLIICVAAAVLDVKVGADADYWVWVADTVTGNYGEAIVGAGDAIYIARGDRFYRYSPSGNSFVEVASPPAPDGYAFKTGAALAWDFDDYIYALYGAATGESRRYFYRYSISRDSWEALAETPYDQGEGDAITWVESEGRIYATIGGEQRPTYFLYYDPATNSWSDAPSDPPGGMGDGASLVWTGNDYVYALRGEFFEEDPTYDFWRYSLSQNIWASMADIPAYPHDGGVGGVGDGGSLLYVGFWLENQSDYIYALSGNQAYPERPPIPDKRFYRYAISSDSWEQLADLPFGIGYYVGCRLAYADGHIYAWQGTPSTWEGGGDDLARYEFSAPSKIVVPDDYPTIQGAIKAASHGDTIFVRAGTYYEHVVVNKSVSIIGEGGGNTIIDGNGTGTVITVTASNIAIKGFTIRNSGKYDDGILILHQTNVTIQDNIICDNYGGIHFSGSSNNFISGNNLTNNQHGIYLDASSRNMLRNNSMVGNTYNFRVWGQKLSDFINDVDVSNTVNGKPIYYWIGVRDAAVPNDAGCVILVNSTNVTVKELELKNNNAGVLLAYTRNTTINRNEIANNWNGILLYNSSNNTITANKIANNREGIHLTRSSHNIISRNELRKNAEGIYFHDSSNNTITGNIVTANYVCGIYLQYSSNNTFYHNFFENTRQVRLEDSINVWDDGYPSGGNYWSDYEQNYPNAKELNGSGIWDAPYVIDERNQDRYPLMYPYGSQTYKLIITATAGGLTNPSPGTHTYLNGTRVEIAAIADAGFSFSHWLLDGELRTENPITILMDSNHTLEAYFVDDIPPELSEPWQDPPSNNVQPNQNVTVWVNVTDYGTGIKNVTLWYSLDNGTTWEAPINMKALLAPSETTITYEATIPGYEYCTWITYKIMAYDNAGNNATRDNNGYFYKYHVIPEFPSTTILTLPMLTILIATILLKKRKRKPQLP